MKCIILNVNTATRWKGKPISEVMLTLAKSERDVNDSRVNSIRKVLKIIQCDFGFAKVKFYKDQGNKVTNKEYVDFINSFIKARGES